MWQYERRLKTGILKGLKKKILSFPAFGSKVYFCPQIKTG